MFYTAVFVAQLLIGANAFFVPTAIQRSVAVRAGLEDPWFPNSVTTNVVADISKLE